MLWTIDSYDATSSGVIQDALSVVTHRFVNPRTWFTYHLSLRGIGASCSMLSKESRIEHRRAAT